MTLGALIESVIDRGIEAARRDYSRPDQQSKLEGAIAGFEACRRKCPAGIARELDLARRHTREARARVDLGEISGDEYWRTRCFEAEVEWVANCVSVILLRIGLKPIVPPTMRAAQTVAQIINS